VNVAAFQPLLSRSTRKRTADAALLKDAPGALQSALRGC
jgi:hypothetical protein